MRMSGVKPMRTLQLSRTSSSTNCYPVSVTRSAVCTSSAQTYANASNGRGVSLRPSLKSSELRRAYKGHSTNSRRTIQTLSALPLPSPDALFTIATVGVMPIYTLMIAAPRAAVTKTVVTSPFPYSILGLMYAYLLWYSWSPDTLSIMFANEYFFPELSGMATMFARVNVVASAWLHLLAADLFSARHVYMDAVKHNVFAVHSLILCCMFGPIGILSHIITKAIKSFLKPASAEAAQSDVGTSK